jgi:hypothetical protein
MNEFFKLKEVFASEKNLIHYRETSTYGGDGRPGKVIQQCQIQAGQIRS